MAFVVEDGTGLSDANAYISIAFADQYYSDRGNSDWAGLSDLIKEQSIVKATAYIDNVFSDRFIGMTRTLQQALQWPRLDSDGGEINERVAKSIRTVPVKLMQATAEYALRSSINNLAPDPVQDPTNRVVTGTTKKVGPIENTVRYSDQNTSPFSFRSYPEADNLLKCLLSNSGRGGISLLRA